jgi:hypothetical protein
MTPRLFSESWVSLARDSLKKKIIISTSMLAGVTSVWRRLPLAIFLLVVLTGTLHSAQFEARQLALPQSLWTGGASSVAGELSGRVSMRKVKYARVLSERSLLLPKEAAGWVGQGTVRRMNLQGQSSAATLGGVNEARLDYLTEDPSKPGCLGFAVELGGGGSPVVFVSDPLETVDQLTPGWADGQGRDEVAVARAEWASKGVRYQLARLLDREPDQLWRYSQDGLSTFVQRRFRKDLRDVGALDVVLLRGQDVQVNLVVSLDPEGKGKTVLDWYAIPKRIFELGDGRTILRLYVGRHLRDLAPGNKMVLLKEVALMFFKQNQDDVVSSRNVEKILFVPSGLDAKATATGLPRNLPARAREVFAGRGELAANLQELSQAPWKDMPLADLSVLQSPQEPEMPFAQIIESARLVNVAPRRDVPALLAATAERCASFGAACDIDDPNGLAGQTPLWTLDFGPLAGISPESNGVVTPACAQKLFSSTGRLGFISAPDGLTIESTGGDLSLETGVSFIPEPGREYSLWLELGRLRQGLAGVEAQAYGSGKSVTVAVKPGFPAVFSSLPDKVEGVRLRFAAGGPEMSVSLRRAVLQSYAKDAARQNVFSARYLFDESRPLKLVRSGRTGFSLEVPKGPMFSPQWLLLDVAIPPWTVNDKRPQLELSLAGKQAVVDIQSASSRIAVYLPGLQGLDGRFEASGWPKMSLSLAGGGVGSGLDCSRAVLSGQRLATWPEVLGDEPLLELAGKGRTLEHLDSGQATRMAASANWLSMGAVDISAGSASARFMKNPWLEVEALLLSNASGPELSSLGKEQEPASSKPGKTGKWVSVLAMLAGAALFWGAGRKGRLARAFDVLAVWLARSHDVNGRPLPVKFWLLGGASVAASGLVLGAEAFRMVGMLGTTLAVPLWRASKPWLAGHLPSLAKSTQVYYCSGFLVAVSLAALIRMAGLAPVSELFGLCGLWLFCAALATYLNVRSNSPGSIL